jgi:AcrR family transcriptional regulator
MKENEQTRERLLEAAGPIFAEKGFQAANVRAICREAGVNLGAINYHFRSKEQFYVETIRHALNRVMEAIPWSEMDSPPDAPPEEALRRFLHGFLRRLFSTEARRWCHAIINREMREPTEAAWEFVRGIVRPSFERLQAILDRMLPADVSLRERNLLGGSIVGQALHYGHAEHVLPLLLGKEEFAALNVDVLTDHITRFSLAAIHGLYPAQGKRKEGGRS